MKKVRSRKQGSAHRRNDSLRERVRFYGRFLKLAGPFWTTEDRWTARWLTAALVVLTVVQVSFPIMVNVWSEWLFDVLEQKSLERFLPLIGLFALILLGSMTVQAVHLRVKRRLQLSWRRWLTRRLLGEWMDSGHHYQVAFLPGEHDNPDGRIAEDIRIGTEVALDLAHSLLYCVLLLISFTQILWSLSGTLEVRLDGLAFDVPGHLVWVALLYAVVGSYVAIVLGYPLVRAVNRRQSQEADFRFGLVHARENSETIALMRGDEDERRRFGDLFHGVERAWNRQTRALTNLSVFTAAYQVLSTAFPVLVAAPRYIAGDITLGMLMRTAQAFQQMTAALSWPVDNMARVAEWKASVERVLSLHEALFRLDHNFFAVVGARTIELTTAEARHLVFRDLTVAGPDGAVVIAGFDAVVEKGEHVLVTGEPAVAMKLFKVVAGLWPWGAGRVELPPGGDFFFLPQRPYLPIGTLRNALTFPSGPEAFDAARLVAALERVGLEGLADRLEETGDWSHLLSMAEQQRIGFARLLLHRPDWIFIQEATDALDPRGEEEMMQLLREEFTGATVLTIGYHPALAAFHDRTLTVERAPEPTSAEAAQ